MYVHTYAIPVSFSVFFHWTGSYYSAPFILYKNRDALCSRDVRSEYKYNRLLLLARRLGGGKCRWGPWKTTIVNVKQKQKLVNPPYNFNIATFLFLGSVQTEPVEQKQFCEAKILQYFGSVFNWIRIKPKISIRIRIRIQKTLNPDPNPNYFLKLSEKKFKLLYKIIIIRFSHQKRWIER